MQSKITTIISLTSLLLLFYACQKSLIPKNLYKPKISETENINDLTNNAFFPEFHVRPPLELLKEFRSSSAMQQKIKINENILFVPTRDGKIETYDLINLNRVSRKKMTKKIRFNVLPVENNLLISQEYGEKSLYLFDPIKNRKLWTIEIGSVKSIPKVFDNKIFVATLYDGLICLDLNSGAKNWEFNTKSQLHTSPIIGNSDIFQISEEGNLYSLNLQTGDQNWKQDIGGTGIINPILCDGKIICCTLEGSVKSYSVTGKPLWRYKSQSPIRRSPAATKKLVIIFKQDGKILALDLNKGNLIWEHDENIVIGTNPLITDDSVIFGTLDNRLSFLELDTGFPVWELELFGRVRTDPVLWKNRLVVGSENNYLYILANND